jgi:hypothetical protein
VRISHLILTALFGLMTVARADSGDVDWAGLANDSKLPGYQDYDFCGVYAAALSGKIMRETHQQARRVYLHCHHVIEGSTTRYHVFVTYVGGDKLWVADNAGSHGSFPLDTPTEKWVKAIVPNIDEFDIIEERDVRAYRQSHPGP